MRLFLDTANLADIESAARSGVLDGVTTNPTLVAREGLPHRSVIERIAEIVPGDISVEVLSTEIGGMLREARTFSAWAKQVVVKLPTTAAGIAACAQLADEGVRTNLTLCFSAAQALLIAKAGATYCSPFVGRLDDLASDGMQLLRDVVEMYQVQSFTTVVLAASLRSPLQVVQCAKAGAGACTVPAKVFTAMLVHPLTSAGLEAFAAAQGRHELEVDEMLPINLLEGQEIAADGRLATASPFGKQRR